MGKLVQHVALVSQTSLVSFEEVAVVSAALQKQVTRDFQDVWDLRATVDPFPTLDSVPLGYWPVIIKRQVKDAAGIHLDNDGQPFALAQAGEDWSLTASHEVLEMLVDPLGNRMVLAHSPAMNRRMRYLVEVCDPSEDAQFAYRINDDTVGGGVLVSDFYFPDYFEPVTIAGRRYSFTGALTKPLQIREGGYISYQDPNSGQWFQDTWFSGTGPSSGPIQGFRQPTDNNVRWAVKAPIRKQQQQRLSKPFPTALTGARPQQDPPTSHQTARAKDWQARMDALIS